MEEQQAKVMSVKDWIVTILITAIPFVGLIMLFIWAFGSSENPNKKNWAKANLIWMLIGLILAFIFILLFWGVIAAAIMSGSPGEMN